MGDWYETGAWTTRVITFVGVWTFCTVTYAFHGFALGWMPAAVLALIFGLLWPWVALLFGVTVVVILFHILNHAP